MTVRELIEKLEALPQEAKQFKVQRADFKLRRCDLRSVEVEEEGPSYGRSNAGVMVVVLD